MKIETIEINHMHEPMGFQFPALTIQATINGMVTEKLTRQLTINVGTTVVYQTDWEAAPTLIFKVPNLKLTPRTRYTVTVTLKTASTTAEKSTWFETGLGQSALSGQWLGTTRDDLHGLELTKQMMVPKDIKQARLYVTGLGLYEAYIDGHKVGHEYLAPGFTNYN